MVYTILAKPIQYCITEWLNMTPFLQTLIVLPWLLVARKGNKYANSSATEPLLVQLLERSFAKFFHHK